jgi:polyferredoxin
MKLIVALLLFITPWIIFLYAANYTGGTSTFVLLITLAVSAFGFMMLIGGGGGNGKGDKK